MDSGLNLQRLCGILFFYNRVVTWLCSVQDCFVLFCCNEQHLFALPVLPWARVAKVCRWYCRYLVSWEQNYVTGQLIIGSSPIKSHTVFSCWAVNLAFVGCCKFLNDILREISLRVCECTLATFAGILTFGASHCTVACWLVHVLWQWRVLTWCCHSSTAGCFVQFC